MSHVTKTIRLIRPIENDSKHVSKFSRKRKTESIKQHDLAEITSLSNKLTA